MKRRNFLKISALSAAMIALAPSEMIIDDNIKCNSVIKGNQIVFNEDFDFRVNDTFLIADGDINCQAIITKHFEGTNKFNFVYYGKEIAQDGPVLSFTIFRDFNKGTDLL